MEIFAVDNGAMFVIPVSVLLCSREYHFLFFFRDDIRKIMLTKYLANPDYNFEKVNRASVACGPLVKWAIAQVHCDWLLLSKGGPMAAFQIDPIRELQLSSKFFICDDRNTKWLKFCFCRSAMRTCLQRLIR